MNNKIHVRGWDDSKGGHFMEEVYFRPTLFVPTKSETKFHTLDGKPIAEIKPGSIKECREFVDNSKNVAGMQLYGQERYLYQYLTEEYPENVEYDVDKIKLWSLDIETKSENGFPKPDLAEEEILLITLKNYRTKKLITFGSKDYTPKRDDVTYIKSEDETQLLRVFLDWWQDVYPEVITGWNVNMFDITYICNRIHKVLGAKQQRRLSPWGMVQSKWVDTMPGRKEQKFEINGVTILDYLDIYKKFTYTNRESYRLDVIAEIELGQKKLDHSEFDTFKDFYTHGWDKFVDYNLVDVDLVDKLEEKMKLIDLVMLMAYDAKCNYTDTFSQVRLWDVIIYNYLKKFNIVPDLIKRGDKNDQFIGAYVKEPVPGSYDYVVSYDLNSLYPSLIRFLNISPETLLDDKHPEVVKSTIEQLVNKDIDIDGMGNAVAANGVMYSKRRSGFMPELVKTIYDERVQYKKNMLKCKQEYEDNPTEELEKRISKWSNFQMARKIQLNSLYGALGNKYFRYYRLENAEAITTTGQVAIRWIERKLNEYINNVLSTDNVDYVIASDTDSIYLHLGPLVSRVFPDGVDDRKRIVSVLDDFSENKIVPFIDESYDELSDYLHCYEKTLVMKRECISEKGIWTAKKRYILNVWDNEGVRYQEPKLKMMGIEAVRSSTPKCCRKYISDALKIIMEGTEEQLINYIADKRTEHSQLNPEDIGFPRTANNITKFSSHLTLYEKGTPLHVRGSIVYNHFIKTKKLTNKYNIINDGEKIKYVYMKMPNILNENVFSFVGRFPRECDLTSYVNYDIMYDKGFIDPLRTILQIVGWNTEEVNTLESFFE